MLKKLYGIVLCLFLFLNSFQLLASQSTVQHDQKIAAVLRHVLPLNIPEIDSLNDKEKSDLECLAWNLYFEARGGTKSEQIAVTWVPINRGAYAHWSKDICETVFQYDFVYGKKVFQFVWAGFNIGRNFKIESNTWITVQNIAYQVYKGELSDPSNGATYFHHYSVGSSKAGIRLGSHIFYKR